MMMPETFEEVEAINALLTKMREEKKKEETYIKNKECLRDVAASMMDSIGLATTKQIFREVTKELRTLSECGIE